MPNFKFVTILIILVWVADAGIASTVQATKPGQRGRVIKFDPKVPIADRVLPQDDVVIIEKNTFPPLMGVELDKTLNDALDHAMLYDAIAVVRGLKRRGTLVDRGTWIGGTVTGSVVELIKPGTGLGPGANTVTFWHNDGEMFVKHVLVRAGVFPVYSPDENYLLFFGNDESRGLYPGRSFRITSEGVLAAIIQSNGETQLRTTPIYGQSATRILSELRKRVLKR